MSLPADGSVSAQALLGREVHDAGGRKIGKLREIEVGRAGDDLCITAILLGLGAWYTRFGWNAQSYGNRIPASDILEYGPVIRLRSSTDE